jgi:hypothetical protein
MPSRVLIALTVGFSLLGASHARSATLLSFYPIFDLTEGYSDNIELTANNHKADFVNTALAGFTLDFNGPARSGSFQYDTLIQTFASHTEFNSYAGSNFLALSDQEKIDPTLDLNVNDSAVIGSITGGVLATNSGAVSSQVAQTAVSNSSSVSNVFNLQLNKRLAEFWTTSMTAQQNFYTNALQTYYIQGGGPSLLYALRPELQVGVSYTFLDFRFSNQSASETHSVQALVNWSPTERLKASLSAGIVIFDNLGGNSSLQAKPVGFGSLNYSGERWTITGSGGQVASGTGGLGGAGVEREAYGVINYALQRHTFVNIGASYSQFVGGGSDAEFWSYGAGISNRPYKWLTLFALYQGFRNKVSSASNVTNLTSPLGQTAVSNTYTLGLTLSFDAFDYSA